LESGPGGGGTGAGGGECCGAQRREEEGPEKRRSFHEGKKSNEPWKREPRSSGVRVKAWISGGTRWNWGTCNEERETSGDTTQREGMGDGNCLVVKNQTFNKEGDKKKRTSKHVEEAIVKKEELGQRKAKKKGD